MNRDDTKSAEDEDALSSSSTSSSVSCVLVASTEQLEALYDDVQYLWASSVLPVYDEPPTALTFLRDHVSVSRPCVIRNSILVDVDTTHAHQEEAETHTAVPLTLTLDDIVQRVSDAEDNKSSSSTRISNDDSDDPSSLVMLTVDVTPDGRGDCLRKVNVPKIASVLEEEENSDDNEDGGKHEEGRSPKNLEQQHVFVKPLERKMTLSQFRHHLRTGRHKHTQQQRYQQTHVFDRVFDEETIVRSSTSSGTNTCIIRSEDDDKEKNCGGQDQIDDDNDDDTFLNDCVLYYSRQNDCLRDELSLLWNATMKDGHRCLFPRSFSWAEEAFFSSPMSSSSDGMRPDAINLWIGDERAVSSTHKDHYENLFYVLSGEKVFTLYPPSDVPFLYEQEVMSGRFMYQDQQEQEHRNGRSVSNDCNVNDNNDGKSRARSQHSSKAHRTPQHRQWTVSLDRENDNDDEINDDELEEDTQSSLTGRRNKKVSTVHWIAASAVAADTTGMTTADDEEDEFPLLKYAHPITVKVRAGELLYLPSLWFHRVTQSCETVGINYWYDMNFESPLWCYFHFLQQLQKENKNKRRGHH